MLLIPIFTGARLDGERCIRHVNTEPFLLFTYVIRLKIDVQACLGLKRIHAVLNLTRSLFCCCWASCENWHKCANELDMMCCRIWSWSRMPCGKHGPRDSVDKNRGRRPRFLSLLRPEGQVFHTAWGAMIKSYYSTLTDWICFSFCSQKLEF